MSDLEQTANPIENKSIEGETDNSDHKAENPNASSTLQGHDAEKAAQPKPSGSDPPDGGTVAWLVILGAWCTSFCSFGWLNSIGVFQEYYETELLKSYSPSTISWIPSLQIFFMMGMVGFPVVFWFLNY